MDVKYTLQKDDNGTQLMCIGPCCENEGYSVVEFYGFCELCWLDLTPTDRAILQGKESPPPKEIIRTEVRIPPVEKEIVTHHMITTTIPPKWETRMLFLWRVLITSGLTWLILKQLEVIH